MKKILIVGSTHGHERIGLKVIEELTKLNLSTDQVFFEVGNPLASEKNIPYTESDLNRVFPGRKDGTYEERRAFVLSQKIVQMDVVIDIHSTNTTDLSDNSMLIVTKYDRATQEIIAAVRPPKVLYMRYKGENALISAARIGIAFEYGEDDSQKVLQGILHDIAVILIQQGVLMVNPYSNPRERRSTDVFEVYDVFEKRVRGECIVDKGIQNFRLCTKGTVVARASSGEEVYAEEDFLPILFRENRYTEILGFKARQIGVI